MFRLALISLALLTSLPAAELTVASFNIRLAARGDLGTRSWKARRDLVVETIRKMDPDLFGVQEALPQQMDYLTRELPDYHKFGVGRDDGKNRGEYSAIFIRAERLTRDVEEGGTFWLSGTPAAAGSKSWGNGITRICTWTRLVDQKTGSLGKRTFIHSGLLSLCSAGLILQDIAHFKPIELNNFGKLLFSKLFFVHLVPCKGSVHQHSQGLPLQEGPELT